MLRPIWRNALRKTLPSSPPHPAFFHSTPVACAKWKNKFVHKDEGRDQRPSKTYARYVVREKRADAKRALKDLLNGRYPNLHFQDEDILWHAEEKGGFTVKDNSDDFDSQPQTKKFGKFKTCHSLGKHKHNRSKRKRNNGSFYSGDDDDGDMRSDTIFRATFDNRCYTWSFRPWNGIHVKNSAAGFEWRDGPSSTRDGRAWESSESDDDSNWTNNKTKWERESDYEDDDDDDRHHHNDKDLTAIGSYSYRVILGLPPTGPMKIDDVKNAFRVSALKWHPDKHQGPSQSIAEEKFKRCLDAYKFLCNALNAT